MAKMIYKVVDLSSFDGYQSRKRITEYKTSYEKFSKLTANDNWANKIRKMSSLQTLEAVRERERNKKKKKKKRICKIYTQ